MILVLFGLPGAGKTYIGKLLEEKYKWHFYDGDADLPQSMLDALKNLSPITDEMRDEFINRLVESARKLKNSHKNLVVSQTFLKEKHRRQFLDAFDGVQFVLVKTDEKILLQRLYERRKSTDYVNYAKIMIQKFEEPKIEHMTIDNSGDNESLEKQLEEILKV